MNNQTYDQHTHLPLAIMNEIKPIFSDLSNPNLLSKWWYPKSLNSVIWTRLPKSTFVLKITLELGVYEAVTSFNEGNIAK